jgi:hypothetical protein
MQSWHNLCCMRRSCILFVVFFASMGFAQTCVELIPKLMETSGLNRSLRSTTETFKEHITDRQDQGSMLLEDRQKLLKALDESFDVSRINNSVKQGLLAKCDAKSATEAIRQLQSPLAQRMLKMEADAEIPENSLKMDRYIRAMYLQTPHTNRVKLVDGVLDANGYADLLANAVMDITIEMRFAPATTRPPKGQIEQMKATIRAHTLHDVESAMMFIYRSATDEDLKEYVALLHSPELKSFFKQTNELYVSALQSEASSFAAQLRKIESESEDIGR